MTPVERVELAELRAEMRDRFDRLDEALTGLGKRVVSLETSRAVAEGISEDRDGREADARWRLGLLAALCGSVSAALVGLIARVFIG